MNKTLRKCAAIGLGVLGVSIGKVWYEYNERNVATANRNALIESAVSEINKSAPRMVDEVTRLDSAQYSAGKLSTFYTLPNTSLADIDKDKLFTIGRNAAKSHVCSKKNTCRASQVRSGL